MKLLVDQGLPRSAVQRLREAGVDVLHVAECGFTTASDRDILDLAYREGRVVVTLDADFHALLAISGAQGPSVIRVRVERLRGDALATLLRWVLDRCAEDLGSGALVTVTENQMRIHQLPVRGREH